MQQGLLGFHGILWLRRHVFFFFAFFVIFLHPSDIASWQDGTSVRWLDGQLDPACLSSSGYPCCLLSPAPLVIRLIVGLFIAIIDDNFLIHRVEKLRNKVASLV